MCKGESMTLLSRNIQLLIWEKKRDYATQGYDYFLGKFAKDCKLTKTRLLDIMKGEVTPTNDELDLILENCPNNEYGATFIKSEDMVEYLDSFEQDNLMRENVMYLLSGLGDGETQLFVEKTGVNASTVTRWKQGTTTPNHNGQEKIVGYFGLGTKTILKNAFFFYNIGPWPVSMRKRDYILRIQNMDNEEFEKLDYALSKIL